jgi:hypothetical protein
VLGLAERMDVVVVMAMLPDDMKVDGLDGGKCVID